MKKFLIHHVAPRILKQIIWFIGRTARVEVVEGKEIIENLIREKNLVIFSFWHNRIFYSSFFLRYFLMSKGYPPYTVLISRSKDGELISRVVELWGGKVARGSTSRGGREALTILRDALRKDQSPVVTTPDGPRGPKYKFQEGTLTLAQVTSVPIVPVSYAARRYWQFKSWDSFIIPKPFTRIYVSFLPPYPVGRRLTEEERASSLATLEKDMMAQVERLEERARGPLKKS